MAINYGDYDPADYFVLTIAPATEGGASLVTVCRRVVNLMTDYTIYHREWQNGATWIRHHQWTTPFNNESTDNRIRYRISGADYQVRILLHVYDMRLIAAEGWEMHLGFGGDGIAPTETFDLWTALQNRTLRTLPITTDGGATFTSRAYTLSEIAPYVQRVPSYTLID